jgi:hypothetical protein
MGWYMLPRSFRTLNNPSSNKPGFIELAAFGYLFPSFVSARYGLGSVPVTSTWLPRNK